MYIYIYTHIYVIIIIIVINAVMSSECHASLVMAEAAAAKLGE